MPENKLHKNLLAVIMIITRCYCDFYFDKDDYLGIVLLTIDTSKPGHAKMNKRKDEMKELFIPQSQGRSAFSF